MPFFDFKPAAAHDLGLHIFTGDRIYLQLDETVVEEDALAWLNILRKMPVSRRDTLGGSNRFLRRQYERGPFLQEDAILVRNLTGSNLRTGEVLETRDGPAEPIRDPAYRLEGFSVMLVGAVRKVEPEYVRAAFDEALDDLRVVGRRAEGGDDLGSPHVSVLEAGPLMEACGVGKGRQTTAKNGRDDLPARQDSSFHGAGDLGAPDATVVADRDFRRAHPRTGKPWPAFRRSIRNSDLPFLKRAESSSVWRETARDR